MHLSQKGYGACPGTFSWLCVSRSTVRDHKVGRRWGATAYPGHGSSPTCPARAPAGTGLPGPGHAMARYQRRPNQTATLPNPINL